MKKKNQRNLGGKKNNGTVDYSILFFGDEKPSAEKIRGIGAVFEDISSKMSTVIEKVESSEERLGTKIDGVEEKLSNRMGAIEAAVTHHTKILNEHSKELSNIKQSIKQLDDKVTKKFDDHEQRIVALEKDAILS